MKTVEQRKEGATSYMALVKQPPSFSITLAACKRSKSMTPKKMLESRPEDALVKLVKLVNLVKLVKPWRLY